MWRNWNCHTLLVGLYNGETIYKTVSQVLKKLNMDLPYEPAIPLPGIYPREKET